MNHVGVSVGPPGCRCNFWLYWWSEQTEAVTSSGPLCTFYGWSSRKDANRQTDAQIWSKLVFKRTQHHWGSLRKSSKWRPDVGVKRWCALILLTSHEDVKAKKKKKPQINKRGILRSISTHIFNPHVAVFSLFCFCYDFGTSCELFHPPLRTNSHVPKR